MPDFQSSEAHALAFLTGVALHIFVFRKGEWDLVVPRLLALFLCLQLSLSAYLMFSLGGQPFNVAWKIASWLGTYLIVGITISMITYRLFFHRLNKFPGPLWARLSNFYVTMLSARNLHLYEEVEKLHQQYGDFVRLGQYLECNQLFLN